MKITSIEEKLKTTTDPIVRGRLCGQLKSLARGEETRRKYAELPCLCQECNSPLSFEQRHNKFCSHGCSATFNNSRRKHKEETKEKISKSRKANKKPQTVYSMVCETCNTTFVSKRKQVRFCSRRCVNVFNSHRQKQYALLHPELTYRRSPYRQSYLERSFEGWLQTRGVVKGRKGFLTEVWFRDKQNKKIYRADFVFPQQRLVVELDGTQHQQTVALDNKRDSVLRSRGWNVVRVTHKEYKNKTKLPLIEQLLSIQ